MVNKGKKKTNQRGGGRQRDYSEESSPRKEAHQGGGMRGMCGDCVGNHVGSCCYSFSQVSTNFLINENDKSLTFKKNTLSLINMIIFLKHA